LALVGWIREQPKLIICSLSLGGCGCDSQINYAAVQIKNDSELVSGGEESRFLRAPTLSLRECGGVFRLLIFGGQQKKPNTQFSSPPDTKLCVVRLHLGVLPTLCQIFCVNFYQKLASHNRPVRRTGGWLKR